jgi:hypothetical protein
LEDAELSLLSTSGQDVSMEIILLILILPFLVFYALAFAKRPRPAGGSQSFYFWLANLAAWGTWLVTVGTVFVLLGGLHPSDESRDRTIVVSSVFIFGLSSCVVFALVNRARYHAPRRELIMGWVMFVVLIIVAISALRLAGSISHEHRYPSSTFER